MNGNEVIARIREGDDQAFSNTYKQYRKPFVRWILKQYQSDEENAIELYQLAFTTFYDQVMSGKLTHISVSLKTYLFSIGKYKFFQQQRESARFDHNEEEIQKLGDNGEIRQQKREEEKKFVAIEKAMQKLGDPCRSILFLHYYEERSMNEIALTLGYKNADTAKNQKFKCMRRLKKMLENKVQVND